MNLEIIENHRCDECASVIKRAEPDHCLCSEHLEEMEMKAYKEGVADTKREYNIKEN